MLEKVWGPRTDEIPLKRNFSKCRKKPSRRPEGSSKVCSWNVLVVISKERNAGMGSRKCPAIWSKPGESSTEMAKVTSREAWGTIEVTSSGEDRLTWTGTDLNRSRYASSTDDEEPPALRRSRGKESNVVRHC